MSKMKYRDSSGSLTPESQEKSCHFEIVDDG